MLVKNMPNGNKLWKAEVWKQTLKKWKLWKFR